MSPIISIKSLSKTYASGFQALKSVDLDIRRGEIFALLGPNGAGKTTLINIICGLVNPTGGTVLVDGHDAVKEPRAARSIIGLVPQEPAVDVFESVWASVSFSRGLFGKRRDPAFIEKVLTDLSLLDKKDTKIMTLSGGMKRRVMIAKALSHQPRILFLDEPTAGVDVEIRRDMWKMVRGLQAGGVTIILTTHYIAEAEQMADRVGVINKGEIILVEDKATLIQKLGQKRLTLHLQTPLTSLPEWLVRHPLTLAADGTRAGLLIRRTGGSHRHRGAAQRSPRGRNPLQGSAHDGKLAGGDLPGAGKAIDMNVPAVQAIYTFEMARTWRTPLQSIVSPVISTSLYFVVFGAAIGSQFTQVEGVSYGAFIVPGLIMLMLLTQSISNASFAIYFPKLIGTIYQILSAPISYVEIVLGYVGAAATKSVILGLIVLATAAFFVELRIEHPAWMVIFLVLTAVTFSLFGFIIGIWADTIEKLQTVPLLIVTPLTFLGGSFYSIDVLPPFWRTVSLFNPVVYLISGFRWSFYGAADVSFAVSLGMTVLFLAACLVVVRWIFKTGYRLKT